jgi:hypothetical protein
MLPMFLAIVDQTIVATALPAIAASLGDVERLSWIVISYLVASTIAAPVYGRLGDVFGRTRLILWALALFVAASILCALCQSVAMLTVARIVQGMGGGGLMTLSQALVGEAVPPRERARYSGLSRRHRRFIERVRPRGGRLSDGAFRPAGCLSDQHPVGPGCGVIDVAPSVPKTCFAVLQLRRAWSRLFYSSRFGGVHRT